MTDGATSEGADTGVMNVLLGAFAGPEMMPPGTVDPTLLDRIRNAS